VTDGTPTSRTEDRQWTSHTDAQRRRLARLPLSEKLAWLEEAQKIVEHLQAQTTRNDQADTAD
jgi:hypothetical protein